MIVNQRDIILVLFPYSDLGASKKRPAVVLSDENFNSHNEDMICCPLTSNPKSSYKSVMITDFDLEEGYITKNSRVKSTKISRIHKKLIHKKLAKLSVEKSKKIVNNLKSSITIR